MIKLVYCVRKRAEISDGEFRRYWLDDHGPRVRGHAAAIGARRYVQSHTVDTEVNDALRASRGNKEPYDGITEVWFDSLESLVAGTQTPAGAAAAKDLLEDERHFIDLEASSLFLTEEHVIFDL